MKRSVARPLLPLAVLLAIYLCLPFIASVPQISHVNWANVDWRSTWSAVGVSVASASTAALIILIAGVPLGYWLARSSSRAMAVLGFVVQLPLALPPLTSGILLLFLVGPYSAIGHALNGALTDSFAGIVVAETFVAAPFLIVAARSAFSAVDPVFEDVAATLGHHAMSRFMRVVLPAAWPGIRAGLALTWLRAFGEFGATVMVAYHPYSLPVYTYVLFGGQGLPAMMPLLLPTLAIAIACAVFSAYSPRARYRGADERIENGAEPVLAPVPLGKQAKDNPRLSVDLKKQLGTFHLDVQWAPSTRRLAIIGPSGSGKSLALKLIAGLEHNDAGSVTLGQRDLGSLEPEHRQIGYMPQDYGLFPHMTVSQQLAFPIDADAASARYWTDHLGLGALLNRLPHQLSFGQRQRVALARALTRHSHLLLFDEPFSALDTPRRRQLRQSLRELQREISAVTILVTHDPDEAALLADELLVIDQGRVLQAGPTERVFAQPASLRVSELLGLRNIGAGTMHASGLVEVYDGLMLETANRTIDAGANVMWRIASRAIRPGAGPNSFKAKVHSIELRNGERYACIKTADGQFDVSIGEMPLREDQVETFIVDPAGVSVWSCEPKQGEDRAPAVATQCGSYSPS
ncbi:ATP-binding cassette domain-containing protein [Trinickia dinghuensis]|uniref:ATP-binding cassette domain-containing protein n=1 Tax=Trinickia dinghuensis TaxID=2291023 RepID=A0A3D8JYH4_9BURK|nr:ATP-binding cassette domain-containing protein [Trinickia dinghuensis]RDU98213.1 ATP-binding cassette domain-containing protein [Trinickia dinghuensis]